MAFIGSNLTQTPTPTGQPTGSSIAIDGSIPKISVNDGTWQRAQMGNLATFTDGQGRTSPAHWGFRAIDAGGNLLFDSFGLTSVFQTGTTNGPINISVNVTGTSYVTVNSVNIGLSRTSSLLIWTSSIGGTQTVGAGTCTMGVQVDGLFPSGSSSVLSLQGDVATNYAATTTLGPLALVYVWPFVAAGQHTVALVAKTSAAGVTYSCSGFPNVMVLGG